MISFRKLGGVIQARGEATAAGTARTDAPRPAPGPAALGPTPELPRSNRVEAQATTASGWMSRLSNLFQQHKPSVAGAMAGAMVLPGIIGAVLTPQEAQAQTLTPSPLPPVALVDHHVVQENPFAAKATAEEKLDLLRLKAGELEDRARTLSPVELKAARERLLVDYVTGGGTIGVAPGANGVSAAKRIAFAEPTLETTPANVTERALFKYFWETTGDAGFGLARRGLDELTREGVDKLIAYAKKHDVHGVEKKAELQGRIDPDQRAVVKALVDHDHYGAFIELDAKPSLYAAFGIDPGSVHVPHESLRPVKAGDVVIPAVSTVASTLGWVDKSALPARMTAEYNSRKAFFEDPTVSAEERGLRVLGLLKDYSGALWTGGERPGTEEAGHRLLDAFSRFPNARVLGTTDFNGAGWSVAQSLVLGIDANNFEKRFADAGPTAKTTYLAMHGEMVEAMRYVDLVREARGLPKLAEAFERKSPLGWMIGEESGHTKAGNLDERRPFSSSGLNFGVLMFPGDAEVRALPVKAGFEVPLDIIDGFNNAVVGRAELGDRIVVRDERGTELRVEKQIQRDAEGKAVSWSAIFRDAAGNEVDPSTALGVVVNADGEVKGDGKATRQLDMWWWGFCDRNTAQRLYKSVYDLPELDRDVRIIENGKEIIIPVAEAQKLIDMDVPDLVPYSTMSGFRFDDEPQLVALKDGRTIQARVRDLAMDAGPGLKRLAGDIIAIHDAPGRPMLGTIELGSGDPNAKPRSIDVRHIESITRAADGSVTVKLKPDNGGSEVRGTLLTDVPWAKAERDGGARVLKQTDDFVIRGAFTLERLDGTVERVNASDVSQILGETGRDLRISQFSAWVEQNKGMFATDGSTGVVVSNGMRWANRLDITQHSDETRPDWAPKGALVGIEGKVVRQDGDKLVWIRALAADEKGKAPSSSVYEGFVQVDKNGRIINEGFTSGQPDFGWGGSGPLNWSAPSTFTKYMEPELRLKIFVNGVGDQARLQKLADEGNLPANWRDYLTR